MNLELVGGKMFVGREKELEKLNKLYQEKGFQFVVMYGRRRVGKTTLLKEFIKDKEHIFYVAEEYSKDRALEDLSNKIYLNLGMKGLPTFGDFKAAFEFLITRINNKRLVIVIDEYPYLVGSDKSFSSMLQNLIDHLLLNTQVFLVICGSSMSFMEKDVLSYKSPLYGRKTAEFKINPFDFFTSCKFVPNYSYADKIITYGILGGIPQYLKYFDDKKSIKENVLNIVLSKGAVLYEEPKNLLKQELREPMTYNTIIEAIATGSSKINEIVTKTRMDSDKCSKYILALINLGIIQKELPVGESSGKKFIYKLNDNLFKFWYRFVFNNFSLTEQDESEFLFDNIIDLDWNNYIGRYIFEDICIQYIWKMNRERKLPFIATKVGRWWGNNHTEKKQEEIDIIAFAKSEAIFCECKWRNELIDVAVYEELKRKSKLFKIAENCTYMMFSKSGFSVELKQIAQSNKTLILVELEKLFS